MGTKLITPITTAVSGDERAVYLVEAPIVFPEDKDGLHRYQLIYVVRNGEIAEFKRDLGLEKDFIGARRGINLPSLLEHTVDELISLAEELRWDEPKIDVMDWLELDKAKLV